MPISAVWLPSVAWLITSCPPRPQFPCLKIGGQCLPAWFLEFLGKDELSWSMGGAGQGVEEIVPVSILLKAVMGRWGEARGCWERREEGKW